jgi:hypothetical protein
LIFTVSNVLAINRVKIALGMAQIMHGVQNVGFPTAVVSQQAIDL